MLRSAAEAIFRSTVKSAAGALVAGRHFVHHSVAQPDAGTSAMPAFLDWLRGLERGTLLELGTRRVAGKPSTVRRDLAPHLRHIACDFAAGEDVDVIADAECLSSNFESSSIDAVVALAVFEHIRRPWLAAAEIAKVLRPGGRVWVQTHNCWPIHGYPSDYWRFTREAMETLFCTEVGFQNQASWYEYPAAIISAREPLLAHQEAFLLVSLTAERA